MSHHGEPLPRRNAPDPIILAGILLLFLIAALAFSDFFRWAESNHTQQAVELAEFVPEPEKKVVPLANYIRPKTTPVPTPTDEPPPLPTAVPVISLPTTAFVIADPTAQPTPTLLLAAPTAIPPPATPLPTPQTAEGQAVRVPILMYHYLSSPPHDADKFRLDLSVLPSELVNQLTYLRDNGYTIVSLYDVARARAGVGQLPEKPIVLTFDDGHRDNYTNAFPILQSFGATATFFVITDLADIEHPDHLNWAMIEEMAAAGMDFEIHTKTHRSLSGRDYDFLHEEIFGAQEILAYHTGKLPRFLAYPGGTYDDTAVQFVADLDLWGALTTEHGYVQSLDNRYVMPRVRIRNTTSVEWFGKLIAGEIE